MMHDLIKFVQGNDVIVTKQNKEYVISKVINYKKFIVIDNYTNSFIKINPEDILLIKLHRPVNVTRDTKSLSTPFTKVLHTHKYTVSSCPLSQFVITPCYSSNRAPYPISKNMYKP